MLRNNLKIALRNLWKYPAFSGINVLGLAIGISACLVIYLLARFELSYDTFHADRDRIYRVVSHMGITGETYKNSGVSGALPNAVKQEVTGLVTVAPFHTLWIQQILVPDKYGKMKKLDVEPTSFDSKDLNYVITEPPYFDIFKYEWLVGSPKTSLTEPYKVVLSEKQAQKYFGYLKPVAYLGKTLAYIDHWDTLTVSVSGVIREQQQNTDFHFTDFVSLATAQNQKWQDRLGLKDWSSTNSSSQLLVKLAPGTTSNQVVQQFRL